MLQIKPIIQYQSSYCPHCKSMLKAGNIIWQGMHICLESKCNNCNNTIIEDLRVGHAIMNPYKVDLEKKSIVGNKNTDKWLGEPLLKSFLNPRKEELKIFKEVFKQCKSVIILNCLDFLYGHCLLKLLNVQRHLENHADYGLVVIVPKFLKWMVPEEVAEIWVVDILLKNGQYYYPNFDKFVREELNRFEQVYISKAYSHPSQFNINKFTRINRHSFEEEKFRITFVWREDRIWGNYILAKLLNKLKLTRLVLPFQNWKVQRLFKKIRYRIPSAKFTITGLGKKTKFPEWIEDLRVEKFDDEIEKEVCRVYSDSRLVIGIHGSNMLLPSGHAGMIIDLMPEEKWSNFAQDILYQETDSRLASFRYRYLPLQTSIVDLTHIASSMILGYSYFRLNMADDKPQ